MLKTIEQANSAAEIEQLSAIHSVYLLRDMSLSYDFAKSREIYEQVCDLEASHVGEVLSGDQRTSFSFEQYEGKLYVIQPGGVTDWLRLHYNGVIRAQLKAREDPAFNFYLAMAEAELEEAKRQQALIQTGQPTTMVTLSLCGDDVASPETLKELAREPDKQRGFLRVSVYDGEKLHLYSHSIDRLTPERARELYEKHFQVELPRGSSSIDILHTPIYLTGARHDLAEEIAPTVSPGTYEFVLQQKDLWSVYMASLEELARRDLPLPNLANCANDLRYDIMASFKRRHEGSWMDRGNLSDSVAYAGSAEREVGTEFAGCDTVVSSDKKGMDKAGYVNITSRELWYWRSGTCRVRNCPTKEQKKQVKIGPCDICKNCQKLFDSKLDLKEVERLYDKSAKSQKKQAKKNT